MFMVSASIVPDSLVVTLSSATTKQEETDYSFHSQHTGSAFFEYKKYLDQKVIEYYYFYKRVE